MKKKIRRRAKRVKNGTTMWKVTTMNTKTGTTTVRKVRGTYDEITAKVHRVRSRNRYNAVCAEEMHPWGGSLKEDGRVVALDSLEDEKMFEETVRPKSVDDDEVRDNYDALELSFD